MKSKYKERLFVYCLLYTLFACPITKNAHPVDLIKQKLI